MFYGMYTDRIIGLDVLRTWHPNNRLKMSAEDQFEHNKKNDPDFKVSEIIKSSIRVVV